MGSSFDDMTIDELSEIYRVEKKSRGLSTVRPDLFEAMAKLEKKLRKEYDEQLMKNPDDILVEGTNLRRKRCKQLTRDIIDLRMHKIVQLALRAAMGGHNTLDAMTVEEREYYETVLSYSKSHIAILDRLSGNVRYSSPDITEVGKPKPIPQETIPIPQEEPVEEYYEPEDDIPIPVEETVAAPVVTEKAVEEIPADIPLDIIPEHGEFDLDEEPEMDIPEDELDMISPDEPASKETYEIKEECIAIRMTQDTQKIAGPRNDYDLKEKQVVFLPKMLADALIARSMAVKINTSP